jgi:hypothetical protein
VEKGPKGTAGDRVKIEISAKKHNIKYKTYKCLKK